MMVSPASIIPASWPIVSSVIFPDGSITHIARGFASCLTMSSRFVAPAAPWSAIFFTASWLWS